MRKSGKKITSWIFKNADGVNVEVEVRMNTSGGVTSFSVDLPAHGIDVSNSSIDELKKKVEAELKLKSNLRWDEFIVIRVGNQIPKDLENKLDYNNHTETELSCKATVIQVGTRSDGTQCYRSNNHRMLANRSYEEESGLDCDGWDRHCEVLVPSTKDNAEMVLEVQQSLAELTQKIYKHLMPGKGSKGLPIVHEQLKKLVKAFK